MNESKEFNIKFKSHSNMLSNFNFAFRNIYFSIGNSLENKKDYEIELAVRYKKYPTKQY